MADSAALAVSPASASVIVYIWGFDALKEKRTTTTTTTTTVMVMMKMMKMGTMGMLFSSLLLLLFAPSVLAAQPSASKPIPAPLRDLEWGQLNFLHTTDTHGWLAGHLQEYDSEMNVLCIHRH